MVGQPLPVRAARLNGEPSSNVAFVFLAMGVEYGQPLFVLTFLLLRWIPVRLEIR